MKKSRKALKSKPKSGSNKKSVKNATSESDTESDELELKTSQGGKKKIKKKKKGEKGKKPRSSS